MPASPSPPSEAAALANHQILDKLPAPLADKIPRLPETDTQLRETKEAAQSGLLSQLRALAAGGFGGICAVVVGHPFDLVKVRLQTAERGVYSSAVDVVRKSVARDGLKRGLYAGVSAPLVGVTPMCEFSFLLLSFFGLLLSCPVSSSVFVGLAEDVFLPAWSAEERRTPMTLDPLLSLALE